MKFISLCLGLLCAGRAALSAAPVPIAIPNYSFESPTAGDPIGYTIDNWVAAGGLGKYGTFTNPAVDDPALNHINNMEGTQAAFIFPLPSVSLSQTLITPDAVFIPGDIYSFTLALSANNGNTHDGEALDLIIYYLDGGTQVSLATKVVLSNESRAANPNRINLLLDYTVTLDFSIGHVPVADLAKATGKPIGLKISGDPLTAGGYWDIDNARLTYIAIPEPAAGGLLWLAGTALLVRRRRSVTAWP